MGTPSSFRDARDADLDDPEFVRALAPETQQIAAGDTTMAEARVRAALGELDGTRARAIARNAEMSPERMDALDGI